MRFLFYAFLFLAALCVGTATFLYVALPTDFVRDQVIALVKAQTGRDLRVAGRTSLTFYPDVGVALEDVTLSEPASMGEADFVRMASLELKIPFMPLLRHQVSIERLVLVKPVVNLRIDKQGRRSWDFAAAAPDGAASPGEAEQPDLRGSTGEATAPAAGPGEAAPPAGPEAASLASLEDLQLGDVRIEDGTLSYRDERSGLAETIEGLDAAFRLAGIRQPLHVGGRLAWRGERLPFEVDVGSPADLIEGRATTVTASLPADIAKVGLVGKLRLGAALQVEGDIDLATASLRRLARWLRADLPPGGGLGPLEVKARLIASAKRLEAQRAAFSLDGAKASGGLTLELAGKRPLLKADLSADRLDLNTYLGTGGEGGEGAAGAEATPGESTAGQAAKPAGKAKANVKAAAQTAAAGEGWSDEPIDLKGLSALDADVKLALGSLLYKDVKVGKTALLVTLKDRLLKARFAEVALYGGKGMGTLQLDGRQKVPGLEASFALKGVNIQPLLADAGSFDRLAGQGEVSFGGKASGLSQRAMIAGLQGQGRLVLADGAIVGINVPQMIRALQGGKLNGWQQEPTAKTDFSSLAATFTITDGIATNSDLALIAPLVRIAGEGSIDLPNRQLDYGAKPTLVASLEGQGADEGGGGLTIPVRIVGPWSKPSFVPDLKALVQDPNAAVEAVKSLAGKIKGNEKVKQALESLTKAVKPGQGGGGSSAAEQIGGLIGGLLGKGQQQPAEGGEQPTGTIDSGGAGQLLDQLLQPQAPAQ